MLLSERTGQAALSLVIRLRLREPAERLVHGLEAKETFRFRQIAARTRVLADRGLPAGQVAGGAVTDPTGHELELHQLRAAELASRSLALRAVMLGRCAVVPCVAQT